MADDGSAPIFNPDTQTLRPDATVAGQLATDLNSGSPLMQAAATNAAQASNDRGLVNSSIGVGAGTTAAINAALPIAQQDAQTTAGFGGQVLSGNQAVNLQQMQNQNASLINSSQQASNLYQKTQASVSDILNNPNFDAGAQTQAIEEQAQLLQSGLAVIGGVGDVDLGGLLNFAGANGTGGPTNGVALGNNA